MPSVAPRWAHRKDANHVEIMRTLRQLGAHIIDTSAVAPACGGKLAGFPDLLTIWPSGVWLFVEIKTEDGELTSDEREWRIWNDAALVIDVRTLGDCVKVRNYAMGGTNHVV